LKRRRADLISESLIEDYVALNWLEWNGRRAEADDHGREPLQAD